MAGVLNIIAGDTKGTTMQFQQNGVPISLTDNSVDCRVATPITTVLPAVIANPANGEAVIAFGTLPEGTFAAEIIRTEPVGTQTSEKFTINVRLPL